MERITKKEYYLGIAKAVAQRSPCLSKNYGAIIVKNDSVISTGYNGPARGIPHCIICARKEANKTHKSDYDESCPAVHAEENAIINAAREGISTVGSTLYLWGKVPSEPCYRCRRAIINAGIKEVIIE